MKSIRLQLWAGMMALVSVVLILLWLFQIVFLKNFYEQIKIADIKEKAQSIAILLQENKPDDFRNQMDALAYDNNLGIELLNTSGKSIYLSQSTGVNGQMQMMRNYRNQAYRDALAGQETAVLLTHPRFGNKFILIGLPVYNGNEISGALILNLPLAPVEDTASILQRQLLYISFILLAAALLISFLLARSFTGPIVNIKKAAEKMAAGDFTARITVKQKNEIGQLAQTINYLGQELAKIDQLRKDLIANVSHELRTPLSLIRGYAETIRDITANIPEKREKQLGIIIEETERLSTVVDDILNLSQLQAGHVNLHPSCFPIIDLISKAASKYDWLSRQTGIAIKIEYSGDDRVEADEARIEQVLHNLINNAVNHSSPGGTVSISGIALNGKIRITVSDHGSGIPENEIAHIWDRYYQAETKKAKKIGTGLGLAIVKAILEVHGADFGVESQKDAGTTFWFELKQAIL
jgi:Signal transduction histidine kinase